MPLPVQIKRSGTAAATPSSLLHGEVALNYADGKLFWKDASNVIQSFTFQAYALSSHTHAASDITSGTLDAARIANDSITYAKIQNVSATDRLLGRSSAGSGDVEEVVCTSFARSILDDTSAAGVRTTIGAAPTASPTFTGTVSAAAASFTGAVTVTSPLTLSGTVAGNVRYLEFSTSGSTRWRTTAHFNAETGSNAGSDYYVSRWSDAGVFLGTPLQIRRDNGLVTCESGLTIGSGQLLVAAGSVSACGVAFSGDPDTGIAQLRAAGANTLSICTNSAEAVRVNASQNVGIGVAPSYRLHIAGGGDPLFVMDASSSQTCAMWFQRGGVNKWFVYSLNTDDSLHFATPTRNPNIIFDTDGNIRVNNAAKATSAVGCIHIRNGTAPTASITDGVVLFAADVSSFSELRVRDEAGNTTTLSPHAFPLIPEGPSEPMAWAYYSERDGRRINVDMLRVVRLLEQLTGEKLVYED